MTRVTKIFEEEMKKAIEEAEKKGEKKKALEIAKSLLDYLQPEVISKATKLPLEEVKKLKNE